MQKILAPDEYSDIAYKVTPQGGIALSLDNRENAKVVEICYRAHSTTINPIVDWTDSEVWEFIHEYNIPYCSLYDEGYKRLGCIGCPMGSEKQRREQFERWPKYKDLYLKAFQKMLEYRGYRDGLPNTPEEVFEAWLDESRSKHREAPDDQIALTLNE